MSKTELFRGINLPIIPYSHVQHLQNGLGPSVLLQLVPTLASRLCSVHTTTPIMCPHKTRYRGVEAKKPDSSIRSHDIFIKCGIIKFNHIYTPASYIISNTWSTHKCSKKGTHKKESINNELRSDSILNHTYISSLSRKSLNLRIHDFVPTNKEWTMELTNTT